MFKVLVPGWEEVEVSFKHVKVDKASRLTCCIIEYGPEGAEKSHSFSGRANCSNKDQFVKAIGRKVALTRALQQMHCSKDVRTIIWKAYFNALKPVYEWCI